MIKQARVKDHDEFSKNQSRPYYGIIFGQTSPEFLKERFFLKGNLA
jgi:hypothetical protein